MVTVHIRFHEETRRQGIGYLYSADIFFMPDTAQWIEHIMTRKEKELLFVNGSRLLRTFDELGQIGATSHGGVTRLSLSDDEVEAKTYIIELMRRAGLEVHVDPVANVIGVLNGTLNTELVACGSHVDTVIDGGRYDGSYGVLASIEALRSIKESEIKLSHPLAAIAFTNEEGVRFPTMVGSRYAARLVTLRDVRALRGSDGVTFEEALIKSKLELESDSFLAKYKPGTYVELHIEQGPILENERKQIGVVENIVGTMQVELVIHGSASHAGTTPMAARRDALLTASKIIQFVNNLSREIGRGFVGTVGYLEVIPNAPNVIPGEVKLIIDFRNNSIEVIELASSKINEMTKDVANKEGVQIDNRQRAYLPPTRMTGSILNLIERVTDDLELTWHRMQSGAGHDAMIMRRIADTGMIFVPSKHGKSHSPAEETAPDDLIHGANVLINTLGRLSE